MARKANYVVDELLTKPSAVSPMLFVGLGGCGCCHPEGQAESERETAAGCGCGAHDEPAARKIRGFNGERFGHGDLL